MKSNLDIIFDTCQEVIGMDLSKRTREREYILARSIYYKLARELFPEISLKDIGGKTNTNHATVIHGINTLPYLIKIYGDELYKRCKSRCMVNLGLKDVVENENVEALMLYIDGLEKEIQRLTIINPFFSEILSLTPEQYTIFEQRSQVILKSLKSVKTYDNTPRSAFNPVNVKI